MMTSFIVEKIKSWDKKIIFGFSATALAFLASGYALGGRETSHASAPGQVETPVSARIAAVQPQKVDSFVAAVGALSSKNTSVLASKIMGKVIALNVNEGDYVTAGKVLMKIESGEISAQTFQAQAAYNNAKLQYDRIKMLHDGKAASRMEMDQATLGLESAQAGLNGAKAMESYTLIIAPISGRIVEKRINLGEMTLPGQPLLKIEDNRNLRLETTVKEQDLRHIRAGMPVTVQIDALPGKNYKARVAQVVPASDVRTHSFIVKIDLPSDKGLITGMYGKALFSVGNKEVILVPKQALVEMSGITGVYTVSPDGSARFQMIQPGETHADGIEALTGLKAGDRIVVSRHDARLDGRKIAVAEK